ncbi:MAG: rhodanese-like domain-containing protein [Opitutales bacterium]
MAETIDPNALPLEVSVSEAHQLLQGEGVAAALLIDVREPDEVATVAIEGARHIPMALVPEQLDTLPKDRPILVHCHHGGRSLKVTQFLRAKGFENTANVKGGIDQWAVQIDPAMKRY